MKVIKRASGDIELGEAHGGAGTRKVFANHEHLKSTHFEAMTHGYMPAGKFYDWHDHKDTEEIMVAVKGTGFVYDDEGKYPYEPGDVFIFPANTMHKIDNPTTEQNEMIFVRVKI